MTRNDVKAYRMQEAVKLIQRILPLNRWSFQQSAQFFDSNIHPTVIYNSERCRIKILYVASSRRYDDMIVTHYGRLEVPDDASILLGQTQEKNYALLWHSVRLPLYFLDGLSPQQAKNAKRPQLVKEFEQLDSAKKIKYEPEKALLLHATIWETYGQGLFDIFDTSSKDLWKRYSIFLTEYWKALPQV